MHSVRGWFCWFALAFSASASEIPAERYMVILKPDHRYASIALQEMGREASAILKRSGVALRLRIGSGTEAVEGTIVVVTLHGFCDMEERPATGQVGPLGWTHSENGNLLPFVELACDPIRDAVQSALPPGSPLRAEAMLGRALGRVLAHELYHIAGETFQHGRDGVAQAALSPGDLIANHLDLNPKDAETIRGRQAGLR